MSERSKRQSHPGWAVKFSDGTWLGGAHGWFRAEDAFYADIYESSERAVECLTISNVLKEPDLKWDIVPAWEPLCERLRVEISSLEEANKITPGELYDIVFDLEYVLSRLKNTKK